MVVLNDNSTVRSFHEKPGRCEVYSDLVNTGIYILEPELLEGIPENTACDFGRDFFPALIADGIDVYGYIADGYWCDVGDVNACLKVYRDAMDGKISIIDESDCGISPDAIIEPGAIIEEKAAVAAGAHICSGAYVGAYSVIGCGAVIEGGAGVKRSIVLENARVCADAQLRGCIVDRNAVIEDGAQLFEESVAGAFSRIGSRAMMLQGIKLWPHKALPEGEKPKENIVWGAKREHRFVAGRLQADDPAQAARLIRGMTAEMKAGEIIIARAPSSVADAMCRAAMAGAMAQCIQVYDAGVCSLPQLRYAQKSMHAACAALVDEKGIFPLDRCGSVLSERMQRSILKTIERQDYSDAFSGVTRAVKAIGDCAWPYIADTAAFFRANADFAPKVLLACENAHVLTLAEEIFLRAGLKVRAEANIAEAEPYIGEILVELAPDGEKAFLSDQDSPMDDIRREMMCAWTLMQLGETRLMLPLNATRAVDGLCESGGCHAVYISGDRSAWQTSMAENSPVQFRIQLDGIAAALAFLSALTNRGLSLKQWFSCMPAVCRSYRRVSVPAKQSGAALKRLFENCRDVQFGGGIRLPGENGWAWLSPDDVQPEICVMAESARHETADELCFFYAKQLEKLIQSTND